MADSLEKELEKRVAELGFELVELERVGAKSRPLLRVRIDRPQAQAGAAPGSGRDAGDGNGAGGAHATPGPGAGDGAKAGVTLDDCARVSRALEPYLDGLPELAQNYVLEVSSPGVERPLVRESDWERFAGREVALKGYAPLAGRGRRLEGEIVGLGAGQGETREVRIRLDDGAEVAIALKDIARAHLVFRWD